ncbi:MAG TPA: arginine--tRNA ligase [Fimbriiglobus sp.]|nr:arginine--tRNA ligase [Fimbriiglobus sp.]
MSLLSQVRSLFEPALAVLVPDHAERTEYLGMVRPTDPKNGDYQANFAMKLAKQLGRKPPELANEIVGNLPPNDVIESATVAGPGFINLKLKDSWLASQVRAMAADARLGVSAPETPRRYVIDYSSPNVAKPLHVGHLRSTIIGDALTRLLRFLGHSVVTDNHLGDWGTQFGMLIHGYRHFLDQAAYKADPVRELTRLYIQVRSEITATGGGDDEEEAINPVAEACRRETAKLHAGDPETVALWKQFMPHCLEAIHRVYRRLGILPFDYEHGESFYNDRLSGVVADMLAKGIAHESQGAVVIPNAKGVIPRTEEEQKKEEPPAILRKRDGAFTYTTSDLATVKYRVEHFRPDAMLYVVDFRQALHFKTFFAQARRWGYETVEMQHVSFGSVLGKDGRPLKTREGNAAELLPLIDEATQLGLQKYRESYADRKAHGHDVPDLSDETIRDIAEAVGVGAVKYADLSQNRTSDYKYDPEKMLATEGNTGTYMQYAYARCRAIFRKGQVDEARFRADPPAVVITHPAERALLLQLLRFEDSLLTAAAELMPHHVTGYLWDLAKAFSGFFESCPVLTAASPELRDSRLLLVDLTGRVIHQGLDLLGIRTVERM